MTNPTFGDQKVALNHLAKKHRSDGSTAKSDESINVVTTEVGRL